MSVRGVSTDRHQMATIYTALISETDKVDLSEVAVIAAAIQKQIARDVFPFWKIHAFISAFSSLDDLPKGYWPIIIRDDIRSGATGVHCDELGAPYALVSSKSPILSKTCSHEALEMITDPTGNYCIDSYSIEESRNSEIVDYLVEICDPCQAQSYKIDKVEVSNFVTRRYFDKEHIDGVQYDFLCTFSRPRDLIAGGYLSWRNSDGDWKQKYHKRDAYLLGKPPKCFCPLRNWVDRESRKRVGELLKEMNSDERCSFGRAIGFIDDDYAYASGIERRNTVAEHVAQLRRSITRVMSSS